MAGTVMMRRLLKGIEATAVNISQLIFHTKELDQSEWPVRT